MDEKPYADIRQPSIMYNVSMNEWCFTSPNNPVDSMKGNWLPQKIIDYTEDSVYGNLSICDSSTQI